MLQNIHSSRIITSFIILMVISIFSLTTGCNRTSEVITPDTHTGEAYFESIFFAFGPFASKLQFHNENVRKQRSMSAEFIETERGKIGKLITKINEVDPVYFANLKKAIEAQDYAQVKLAVSEGGEFIYEHIDLVYPNTEMQQLKTQVEADIESGAIMTEGEVDLEKISDKAADYERLLSNNFFNSGEDHDEQIGSIGRVYSLVYAIQYVYVLSSVIVTSSSFVLNYKLTAGDPLEVELLINDIIAP